MSDKVLKAAGKLCAENKELKTQLTAAQKEVERLRTDLDYSELLGECATILIHAVEYLPQEMEDAAHNLGVRCENAVRDIKATLNTSPTTNEEPIVTGGKEL